MGRGKCLAPFERSYIKSLYDEGCPIRQIAKKISRSAGVISVFLRNIKNYGRNQKGRTFRATTLKERRAIFEEASNSAQSATQIAEKVGTSASISTVRRILQRSKILKRKILQKQQEDVIVLSDEATDEEAETSGKESTGRRKNQGGSGKPQIKNTIDDTAAKPSPGRKKREASSDETNAGKGKERKMNAKLDPVVQSPIQEVYKESKETILREKTYEDVTTKWTSGTAHKQDGDKNSESEASAPVKEENGVSKKSKGKRKQDVEMKDAASYYLISIEEKSEAYDVQEQKHPKEEQAETTTKPEVAKKLNQTKTSYDKLDFNIDKKFNFKISSWNVAGLRAWINKGGVEYIENEKPDIICLQEIRCLPDDIPDGARIPRYHSYWLCKPGSFAGVAIYSKVMPINVEYGIGNNELDEVGRILTAEYEKFYLICVYVPNAGRKLATLLKRLRWNEIFDKYVTELNAKKPVIISGDMNVSHNEIDLANPQANKYNAGFTQEERDGMTKLLSLGYIDTFRHFNPDLKDAFTYWTYMTNARSKNMGWRLDYFIVSERIISKVVDSIIRSKVLGSDHCPITLLLNI